MEEYFSDTLLLADRQRADHHIADCGECRREVEALRAIDPLMKDLLRYREMQAAAPRRLHVGRTLSAAAACLAAAVLAIALWSGMHTAPAGPTVAGGSSTEGVPDKDPNAPREQITKPIPTTADDSHNKPTEEFKNPPEGAPKLAVIDRAGIEYRLENFRGKTVLLGVLASRQPQTAANLEKLFQTYGTKVRLLAVSMRKEPAPPNTTFQVFRNNGSELLGAREGDYAIVDKDGVVVSRGTLIGDPNTIVNAVGSTLKSLDVK
jgi:hypothetical protein